ncbi:MAG: alkaline phosphatase family protein [Actinomycetes bacterium]
MKHRTSLGAAAAITATALVALSVSSTGVALASSPAAGKGPLKGAKLLVVIYEENHSFDNLYGNWGSVGGKHVVGRSDATRATTTQVSQLGTPYACLMQNDVNLTSPPNSSRSGCSPETVPFPGGATVAYNSHFANAPFRIDDYIAPQDKTCPPLANLFGFPNGVDKTNPPAGARAGGCTRDLVHKFYQEIYQLNGGKQNRYVTGSDAVGLSMGYYDTKALPLYKYLHRKKAPHYVIADNFFQGAFGGSYLNHQYLIAAQPPQWNAAPDTAHAVLDSNGAVHAYPLYKPTGTVVDGNVTQKCDAAAAANGLACGNWTVNTSLPATQPTSNYAPQIPLIDDTKLDLNIGDRLSDAHVSWAWYSGGWDNAAGNVGGRGYTNGNGSTCSDPNSTPAPADSTGKAGAPYCPHRTFQQHHQPFAYFARYAPGTVGRAKHLKDEKDFLYQARTGHLPKVSFVKPLGEENEHPGYASEPNGSDHLVDLIKAIQKGPQGKNTLIVVTYDEFGGQWDHVAPPGQGRGGAHDQFGPGTRIPAIVIGKPLTRSGVDHRSYDTTSIIATIEKAYGLKPLDHPAGVVPRDRFVHTLGHAVTVGTKKKH